MWVNAHDAGMSTSYVPYQPDQQYLLPCALQEWLPAGHLAYFISDTVDSLDLGAFHARYASGGPRNQPFHPAMMVKILVYGYATGVFSSRKIARKLHEDVAFRVLAADNFPDVHQLLPVLHAVNANTEAHPEQALADAGYRSEEEMAKLAKKHPQTELVIALGREGREQAKPIDADRYPHTLAMQAKFQTDKGKADYRKRKWIAEPPNGWIKNVLGFRQFSMRGLEKAKAEFKLVCMALNLRRMGAMQMA